MRTLEPYQQRVVDERDELSERKSRLEPFFKTDTYHALPEDEQWRLCKQNRLMGEYLDVLDERIANF